MLTKLDQYSIIIITVKRITLHLGCDIMAKDLRIAFLLDFYGDMLTDKQREVIDAYYNEDLSLAEIAADKSITRQGVRDAIKRAEQQLIEMEDKLGLAKRFKDVQAALTSICDCAIKIEEVNQKKLENDEISESVLKIIKIAKNLALED